MERVAYTPKEFAALFGRSQTWGYRQIYKGSVKAITQHGRKMIPASEVDKILKSATVAKKSVKGGNSSNKPKLKSSIRKVLIGGSKKSSSKSRHTPKTSGRKSSPKR